MAYLPDQVDFYKPVQRRMWQFFGAIIVLLGLLAAVVTVLIVWEGKVAFADMWKPPMQMLLVVSFN